MKKILVVLLAMVLHGCDSAPGVKGAKGETPVKYIICGHGEMNCFVAARFKDLDGCERHKNWSEMLCDSQTDPTRMVCKKEDNRASIGVAYCTL